jgi:very-short-patch-repair endonuclease
MAKNIVIGQKVDPAKIQRAHELRSQMTPEERILWQHLRTNRLGGYHFRRQQIIAGFIVDFYCHTASLIIELDGDIHLEHTEYDAERDKVLSALGFRVLHFRNDEIHRDPSIVLERILSTCKEVG